MAYTAYPAAGTFNWATPLQKNLGDVRAFGALGDGVTDDSAAFTTAIAAAASFVVTPGTYIIGSTLVMNQANQVMALMPGVTLKVKAGGSQNIIDMAAAGTMVIGFGATIDGNNVGTGVGTAIYGHAADQRVEGLTIINIAGYGLNMQGDRVEIVDNNITQPGSGAAGIMVQNASTSVDLTAPEVRGNRVTVNSGSGYGIQMHVNGSRNIFRPRVCDNDIVLPALVSSGLGIELYGGNIYGSVVNNTVDGSSIGISIDLGPSVTVTGNSVHGSYSYGIELAGSARCAVTGNTVDGKALTNYGVSISNTGPGYNTVTGNTIGNLLLAGGVGVYAQGTTGTATVINGNNITAQHPVIIGGNAGHAVTGNTFISANSGAQAVELNGCTDSVVANNVCSGFSTAAVVPYNGTMNGLLIGPNVLANGTPADYGTGWTPGTNGVNARLIRGTQAPPGLGTPSVGASPWTFTNTALYQRMMYIRNGTVSSITKSGFQIHQQSNVSVLLQPGESMVVTYSVAPTVNSDQW